MITKTELLERPVAGLMTEYPFIEPFLSGMGLDPGEWNGQSVSEWLHSIDTTSLDDQGLTVDAITDQMMSFINQMLAFLGEEHSKVTSLTILPGEDKHGNPEPFQNIVLNAGEITCIVGPTGSGKSRLLADIEWMAQADTPTGRKILINGAEPDIQQRFSTSSKLVAQLSQNMNFVIDLSVKEFLELHAESRMIEDPESVIRQIIHSANELTGEKFDVFTPITSLSGGQSRALMIADTAILSRSPIILIDEIENAGIDRKKALGLLIQQEKIVLMATHDPMLALMGVRRLVIRNGGIHKIIETSDAERGLLKELEWMDARIQIVRTRLRHGERVESWE